MGAVVAWLSVGLIGGLYFALDKNASRKRVVFPVFLFLFSGSFIGIIYFAGAPPAGLIFLTFGVTAITVINIYKVRFCDNCGATTGLFRKGILPDVTCPKCGAPLR